LETCDQRPHAHADKQDSEETDHVVQETVDEKRRAPHEEKGRKDDVEGIPHLSFIGFVDRALDALKGA
jgi:hypothetical protein